jgi:cell division protein YceG involved in septum cleavage
VTLLPGAFVPAPEPHEAPIAESNDPAPDIAPPPEHDAPPLPPQQQDTASFTPLEHDPPEEPPRPQPPLPAVAPGPQVARVPAPAPPGPAAGERAAGEPAASRPAAGGLAGRPLTSRGRPHRRRRSGIARVAAVVALLAAIAAVILLVRALVDRGHTTRVVAPKVVKLLIPEGKTRAQIAQIAKAAGLSGSYRVASRRSPLLSPAHYGAPRRTPDLEGFLFPATYDVNPGEAANRLVQQQLVAFRENFGTSATSGARALHVTPYQMLTVASMIEREAQVPGDRAKIAAVIYNRLKQGMPLGIDAAIYYAVEQRKGIATYTSELTEADLHINSPYNTRMHTGLPPTPISNPGLASIHAASHPAHVSYLYYVAAADGCGEQVFSTTQSAFEANAAAYAAAVKRNGGQPPSCKHN